MVLYSSIRASYGKGGREEGHCTERVYDSLSYQRNENTAKKGEREVDVPAPAPNHSCPPILLILLLSNFEHCVKFTSWRLHLLRARDRSFFFVGDERSRISPWNFFPLGIGKPIQSEYWVDRSGRRGIKLVVPNGKRGHESNGLRWGNVATCSAPLHLATEMLDTHGMSCAQFPAGGPFAIDLSLRTYGWRREGRRDRHCCRCGAFAG